MDSRSAKPSEVKLDSVCLGVKRLCVQVLQPLPVESAEKTIKGIKDNLDKIVEAMKKEKKEEKNE